MFNCFVQEMKVDVQALVGPRSLVSGNCRPCNALPELGEGAAAAKLPSLQNNMKLTETAAVDLPVEELEGQLGASVAPSS